MVLTENRVGIDEVAKAVAAGGNGFTDATFSSLSMILVSEVSMGVNMTIQSLTFSLPLFPFKS